MVPASPLFGDDDEPSQAKRLASTVMPLDLHDDAPAQQPRFAGPAPQVDTAVAALDLPDAPAAPKVLSSHASILDLPDLPEARRNREGPPASTSQITAPSEIFVVEEHPSIAPAMKRGQEKFPEIMKMSGFLIRNSLNDLVPLSFDSLSSHGSNTLTRAAGLVDRIAAATRAVAEVRAFEQIQDIVARADSTKHKVTLLGFIEKSVKPFDPVAANVHLTAIKEALQIKLRVVDELRQEMIRIKDSLAVEVATMAILSDMTDHADIGALVVRKASLFNVSLQEVQMALTQVTMIEKSAQEWVMRCDEVKTVTLPALGFRASL
jgi:hypothetical protein